MKVIINKLLLASSLLTTGILLPQSAYAEAPAATKTAVVMDNLSKYGLEKTQELPITVTAGGLSYTLHKIMIYDWNSKDAQNLIKFYQFPTDGGFVANPTHFIWTKITIENKGKFKAQRNADSLREKWWLFMGDTQAGALYSAKNFYKNDAADALSTWDLLPGEKLTTYQALSYRGTLPSLDVIVDFAGSVKVVKLADKPAN